MAPHEFGSLIFIGVYSLNIYCSLMSPILALGENRDVLKPFNDCRFNCSNSKRSEEIFALHWETVEKCISQCVMKNQKLRRRKRKVIPRGGYYMIRSKMTTPWGSTRENFDDFTPRRKEQRSSDTSVRTHINVPKIPHQFQSVGGVGFPYSSSYMRKINVLKETEHIPKRKISRSLKHEIAQYSLRYGPEKTAKRYQKDVGRKLKSKIIEKFAKRYKKWKGKQMRKP
ncbi:hypothetical protein Avbf_14839 [Armadillidium vulgare]|nr:hypothetical protein Avbf_14839 [Armadillidium vulgare]